MAILVNMMYLLLTFVLHTNNPECVLWLKMNNFHKQTGNDRWQLIFQELSLVIPNFFSSIDSILSQLKHKYMSKRTKWQRNVKVSFEFFQNPFLRFYDPPWNSTDGTLTHWKQVNLTQNDANFTWKVKAKMNGCVIEIAEFAYSRQQLMNVCNFVENKEKM